MKFVTSCPVCKSAFEVSHTRLLGQEGDAELLHLTCASCEGSLIALVMAAPGHLSSVGVPTDLSFEDVQRLESLPRVSADDVLALHDMLERHDWSRIFGGRRPKKAVSTVSPKRVSASS